MTLQPYVVESVGVPMNWMVATVEVKTVLTAIIVAVILFTLIRMTPEGLPYFVTTVMILTICRSLKTRMNQAVTCCPKQIFVAPVTVREEHMTV